MFSLNGTLKKSGSVGRWETKQFIGMAFLKINLCFCCNNDYVPKIYFRQKVNLVVCFTFKPKVNHSFFLSNEAPIFGC